MRSRANDGNGRRWPAALAVATSLFGIAYGLWLTKIKYAADWCADDSGFGLCQRTGSDCVTAFSSSWGSWFGLPLTAYAVAFYVVAFVVSLGALVRRERSLYGTSARYMVVLGWMSLGVTVIMASYITFVLRSFCLYCSVLYTLSVFLFLAAGWNAPEGLLRGSFRVFAVGWLARGGLRATLTVASVFVLSTVSLAWGYNHAKGLPAGARPCGEAGATLKGTLPKTPLVMGADNPDWVVLEFVDPACTHCRGVGQKLEALVEEHPDAVQVRVYLFPRDTDCLPNDIVNELQAEPSVRNKACLAATAVLCAEHLKAGTGVKMLDRVYALQEGPSPWFSQQALVEASKALGHKPELFEHCLATDKRWAARIRSDWVRFGFEQGIRNTPRVYTIPAEDGEPLLKRAQAHDGDKAAGYFEDVLFGGTAAAAP